MHAKFVDQHNWTTRKLGCDFLNLLLEDQHE